MALSSSKYSNLIGIFLLHLMVTSIISAKKLTEANEENCEVCVKFLSKFISTLDDESKKDQPTLKALLRKTCKKTKNDDNRFCYYVGGLEESATGMLGDVTMPISYSMPAEKICFKLNRRDHQICDLRYEKSFDLTKVDFKKLKVADLKKILSDWDEECRGCTEKSEYVKLVKSLLATHAPDAARVRTDL